jgi:hypothetical protein
MGTVYFPAKYESVIAVSMIDRNNVIFPFSSRGSEVELCAPGVDILSTIPRGGYDTISGTIDCQKKIRGFKPELFMNLPKIAVTLSKIVG